MESTSGGSETHSIAPTVGWRTVGSRVVLVDVSRGSSYLLEDVEALIWLELVAGRSKNEILARICETYSVGEIQAADDLSEFIGSLLRAGVLRKNG